jgi:Ca-activated chloride channel homolog
MRTIRYLLITVGLALGLWSSAFAAGTLTPVGADYQPVRIESHDVQVILNNGFAMTRVTQVFFNPNAKKVEAVYSFPLPKSASLSEVKITSGERTINGEVVEKDTARAVYEEERENGNDAGLAEKDSYKEFRFMVSQIRPNDRVTITFMYYQPLDIDTGMGRYVYPLREGGTDEAAEEFWTANKKVEKSFTIEMTVKSAWPMSNVRAPGFSPSIETADLAGGRYNARFEAQGGSLDKDFVFYYRLQDNLPGRMEVIPYRSGKGPGTFLMVLTPGLDLKPITRGADYIFVLDKSGSMDSKIGILAKGVVSALGKMSPKDRFRIIAFDDNATEVTNGWVSATPENVKKWADDVVALRADNSTNLYDAIALAMKTARNDDRVTSVILVTDGVTNTGIVDPKDFYKLMKQYDFRVFGFLMGNNANWPLMRMICEASGGFYAGVSNDDDIIGQILQAKAKITHESLHDAVLTIDGVKVTDMTDQNIGKIYNGQQLVFFGRYEKGGRATVTLKAKYSGQTRTYSSEVVFPDVDTDNPEIERLWALDRVEMTEDLMNAGLIDEEKGKAVIRKIGVDYQIVTDETSMLVLSDKDFARYNIDRKNKQRLAVEEEARTRKASQATKSYRSSGSMFHFSAPSLGGGGAIDPLSLLLSLVFGAGALAGVMGLKRR